MNMAIQFGIINAQEVFASLLLAHPSLGKLFRETFLSDFFQAHMAP